jgi:hypothetical protein
MTGDPSRFRDGDDRFSTFVDATLVNPPARRLHAELFVMLPRRSRRVGAILSR